MRRRAVMAMLLLGLAAPVAAQQIPALAAASDPGLVARREALMQERATLHGKIDSLNSRCGAVEAGSAAEAACNTEQAALLSALAAHIRQSNDFNAAAQAATIASNTPASPSPDADPEEVRVINGINALAGQLGWSAEKRARLDKALHGLDLAKDPNPKDIPISRVWRDIIARGEDADLVREASQGGGLGFPGAGQQAHYLDCTVFALANAAGLPYGVVAARAAELIRQGDWHNTDDRANPQAVIEKLGLNGGEVVMLAEVFGQAQVVRSADFARSLTKGHPVMVDLVPMNGDVRLRHRVVLTKTFQHGGETWYAMMDSYQGPQKRLFVSARQLSPMLQGNGVAYQPDPNTTPQLLRNSEVP